MECPIKKLCNELKATNNWISVVRFRPSEKVSEMSAPARRCSNGGLAESRTANQICGGKISDRDYFR